MKKHEVISLQAGVAIPIVYFGSVVLAALFYPGFSFVRQFASELGANGAPHPQILNVGIIMVGLASFVATFGFWRALQRLEARPIPARLVCYILAMFGVAMVMAGLFPIPNYVLHSGLGLSLPILIGPMLLAIAIGQRNERPWLRIYLFATNFVMICLIITFVAATHSRIVGLCQLLYTLTAVPWIGVSALALLSYLPREQFGFTTITMRDA